MSLYGTTVDGWGGSSANATTTSQIKQLPSVPSTVTTTTTIPGDPGEPATPEERIDYPPKGWTAFANSIGSIIAGYAEFKVEDNVHGAVLGLTTLPAPDEGYSHIQHGLLFTGGHVYRVPSGYDCGTYDRDDVFRITSTPGGGGVAAAFIEVPAPPPGMPFGGWEPGGAVGYDSPEEGVEFAFSRNGISMGTAVTSIPKGARLRLAASMYGPQDAVYDPILVEEVGGAYSVAVLPGMSASSGDVARAQSFAIMGGLSVSSGMLTRSNAELGGLMAFSSDRPLAQSIATLPGLKAGSYESLPVSPTNESFAILVGMAASSFGHTGGIGSGTATLDGMYALSADRPYAGGTAVLGSMEAASFNYPENMGVIIPTFGLFDGIQSQAVYKADAPFGFGLGIAMSTSVAAIERISVDLGLDVPVTLSTIETAEVSPVFWFDAPLECPGAFMDAWAVNLDNGASTEYRSYPFETVANIGGRYFGAAFEGLYELAGDTDAGAPIEAKFDIGRKDFGDHQLKRVENVYLGITSKGQMFVKVSAEGASYTYPMREFGEHIQTQRVTVGKGMRANYFGFEIGNTAGCDFEITSLNMMVAESARRI